MLLILLSILLIVVFLTGNGRLRCSVLGIRVENPWMLPWVGFFIVGTAGMGISCAIPLNIWVTAFFGVTGLTGLLSKKYESASCFFASKEKHAWAYRLICLGTLVLLAAQSSFAEWARLPETRNQCGNSPLPCTSSSSSYVRMTGKIPFALRVPGELGSGFVPK
jgi:hypothetical protein